MLFGSFAVCGFFCGFGVFFAVDAVHAFDYHKNDPGNDEKLDDVLDKIAISYYCLITVAEEIRYADSESGEVYPSGK